jgi:hypothetical protein
VTQKIKARRPLTPDEKELLARFVRFEVSLDEVLTQLQDMLEMDFGREKRTFVSYFLLPVPGVRVEVSHINSAIEKHKRGEITDDETYRWATFLLLNEAYDWEGPDEDEIAQMLNELSLLPKRAH